MKSFCNRIVVLLTFFTVASGPNAFAYNIDANGISISGLSSGAYMASQVQMAHSRLFKGVALFAGGPYLCSQGSLNNALFSCMEIRNDAPSVAALYSLASDAAAKKQIDPLLNLARTKIYFLSGENDAVVAPQLSHLAAELYIRMGADKNLIKTDLVSPLGHAIPTENFGNPCSTVRETPFISACGFSAAENSLKFIYGRLRRKAPTVEKNFFKFEQGQFMRNDTSRLSLAEHGYAYVPTACQKGVRCRLHVALHGCRQTIDEIGDNFYKNTGYNEVAEANNIVVLYPQAKVNSYIGNPRGCWDWWGYTQKDFAAKNAPQISMIYNLVRFAQKKDFPQ
jgi:predicted esterase